MFSRNVKAENYRTTNLLSVFYIIKLVFTLRAKHKHRVFENRILKRTFEKK